MNDDDGGQTRMLTLAFQYETQTLRERAKMAGIVVSHVTPQRLVSFQRTFADVQK